MKTFRPILPFLSFALPLASILLFTSCSEPAQQNQEVIRAVQKENDYSDNLRLKAINEEIAADPSNPIPWAKRAELQIKEGNFDAAIGDARQALLLDSSRADSYVLLASAYRAGRHLDSAALAINRAKVRGYASPELYVTSGEILLVAQRYESALSELNEAIKLAPQNARAYFYKGMVEEAQGDTGRAISDFRRAVSINPEFADGHNKLATMYMRRNQWDLARQHLETGLRFAPEDAYVNFNYGVYFQNQDKLDSARAYFTKAVFFEPSMYLANFQLGMYSYKEKNYLESASRLESTLQYNPKMVEARFWLALCRENLGSLPEALEQYKAVVSQNQGYVADAKKAIARIEGRLNRRQVQEEEEAMADTTQ